MHPQRHSAMYKITIAMFIAVVALGSMGRISQGQTNSWSNPKQISESELFSWFPDIAADPYGNLHVVYASGVIGYDLVLYTTSNNGINWQTPNDVFALPQEDGGSAATRPSLLVDRNSNLNISFVDLTTVYFSRVQEWNASLAQSWMDKVPMSGKQTSYFSRMAIDSKDTLHFVYTENVPSIACAVCFHVFYRQSTDNGVTWSEPHDIITSQNGAVKPQILVDKKDNIHVVWESGLGGGLGQLSDPTAVSYSASYDGGKTWSKPMEFPLKVDELAKNITIGLDRYNHLVVAWWSLPADLIMYQTSSDDGRTWSDPLPIPNVWGAAQVYRSNLDDYAMANDSSGNIHLVAVARVDQLQKGLDIVDLAWDGTEWALPDVVTSYQGDVPEWPRIAVNKGNQLNVVWFVRDEAHIWESDKGQYRVWYSKGFTSAPSIPPESLPTVTPTFTVTPVVNLTSTSEPLVNDTVVTPEPTLNLADQVPPVNVPTSETDYLPLLLKALLPSILFVVCVVVVTMVRRR